MSATDFPTLAHKALRNTQLRRNIRKATTTIRARTARVTAELPDFQALRDAAQATKAAAMRDLDTHLLRLEQTVTAAGGIVHWARDAEEAREIILNIARRHGAERVIKVKSMTTDEIDLNPALEQAGIEPVETDLADMIVQLAHDRPSHILVPAIHRNRAEIRELFERTFGQGALSDVPTELTAAARRYLRARFLSTPVAVSGANFAIAETGTIGVVESEGNGRMCLTLPRVLVSLMGIEKVLPRFQDLEIFLQLLPRSATGERMNPYTSLWTGIRQEDGPQEFHLVLLDNGRTRILADPVARETLHCIRCSRCVNVCPVYERTGGHAYNSMYQGPIGAILTPQLLGMEQAGSLPFASTLCGACAEVCPVNIDIPRILVHLRAKAVEARGNTAEALAMRAMLWVFGGAGRLAAARAVGRMGQALIAREGSIARLPGPLAGWSTARDFPAMPAESFRGWWQARRQDGEAGVAEAGAAEAGTSGAGILETGSAWVGAAETGAAGIEPGAAGTGTGVTGAAGPGAAEMAAGYGAVSGPEPTLAASSMPGAAAVPAGLTQGSGFAGADGGVARGLPADELGFLAPASRAPASRGPISQGPASRGPAAPGDGSGAAPGEHDDGA